MERRLTTDIVLSHIGIDLVDKHPPFRFIFLVSLIEPLYTRAHTQISFKSIKLYRRLFAHLLRELVGIEDSRNGHLEFVLLFLSLTQSSFPLLQKQICGVLARKFLDLH